MFCVGSGFPGLPLGLGFAALCGLLLGDGVEKAAQEARRACAKALRLGSWGTLICEFRRRERGCSQDGCLGKGSILINGGDKRGHPKWKTCQQGLRVKHQGAVEDVRGLGG